ncbi:MAG: winged helix-turn-helix domain-containing protein [Pseudomonadota bacterium]
MEAIEARRIEGARLLKRKVPQAEVARRLGVSRQSVSRWAQQLAAVNGAVGKLKGKRLGRPRRLDAAQCARLREALLKGALHAGFPTELWTVKRVRVLIKRQFGIAYSNTGCWELLRGLGFSPQRPQKRALQRNEQAIATWKRKTWPALKKTPNAKGEPSSSSTSRGCRRSAP